MTHIEKMLCLTKSNKTKRSISRPWVWHYFEKSWLFANMSSTKISHFCGGPETSHHCIPNINCKQCGQQITEKSFKTLNTHGSHSWQILASTCHSEFTLLWITWATILSRKVQLWGTQLFWPVIGKFSGAVHDNFPVICISDKKDNQRIFLSL